MSTISLRVSDEENKLIQSYVAANNLNLSSFIRGLVLDKIEDDMKLDESRIIKTRELLKKKKYMTIRMSGRSLGFNVSSQNFRTCRKTA